MQTDLKVGDSLFRCEGISVTFGWVKTFGAGDSVKISKPDLTEYVITKLTPTGMWIAPKHWPAKQKFQTAALCRFASRTEREAVQCFFYRRKKWITILKNSLEHAQSGMKEAEEWLNKTKLEIDPVTTASP